MKDGIKDTGSLKHDGKMNTCVRTKLRNSMLKDNLRIAVWP